MILSSSVYPAFSLFAIPQMSCSPLNGFIHFGCYLVYIRAHWEDPSQLNISPTGNLFLSCTQGTDYLCKKIPKTPLDFLPYHLFSSGRIRVFINFLHVPRSVLLLLNVCARTCVASSSFLMKCIWGKNTSAPWKWFVIVLSGLLDLQTSQSAHLGCFH